MSLTQLDQLKKMTTVVSDTGDIDQIARYKPTDATTNPSLILKAIATNKYNHLLDAAISKEESCVETAMQKVFVAFGAELLKFVTGRVSTEVDARLSFDAEGSIKAAQTLIKLYENKGIERERVLIKLASTWEGAKAARELEKQGIHCNMTLLFNKTQAIICAMAGVTLISPFVGRIFDWYKNNPNAEQKKKVEPYVASQDPGVLSVKEIYTYYKGAGIKTEIMGASFRSKEEILELAGCDLLTISPNFLEELQNCSDPIERKLTPPEKTAKAAPIHIDEKTYRFEMCEDAMATEKLTDGIRTFASDIRKLEQHLLKAYPQLKKS